MTDFLTDLTDRMNARLDTDDAAYRRSYPGDPVTRRPVHTVYLPADRFDADVVATWGPTARGLLQRFAPDAATLARATGRAEAEVQQVYPRLLAKLENDPIEDLRVDFEDGYGRRSDDIEDAHLTAAVEGLRSLRELGSLPAWWGIRFKSFEGPTRARGLRTLVHFLDRWAEDGRPAGMTLTLPKVTSVAQVEAMAEACGVLEERYGIPSGTITFEIQVETAQAIMAASGEAAVAQMVHAAGGRATALVYGTFDYSAGMGVAAAYQAADHPAADHAKAVMQVAAAQTGATVCDGSTNVVAFGDEAAAHATWRLHTDLVDRALVRGIYQGWDMHPGHLVSRYLATYLFFRRAMPDACSRLRAYLQRIEGDVMDEPATARMLAFALLRGIHCGAIDLTEVEAASGLDLAGLTAFTH
ncbi:DUF6986 family protein [Rudaeicoccus suwonensis]|uniref:HpcH/HpaI aldolase/citrate lyase family protein n=1 Tax=Rudaeicoccus suwonensis TaxID=657409 RepID=A0A561E9X0_9MICO|nr:aldolase/citrate lyase family protein [Rudaeicoccus suwonensis]TWE12412.1 HpcH/HpaI aldolase/citrate lyase family protein [Rudaeicoccus suwonensis]